jgi:hypothetical protein
LNQQTNKTKQKVLPAAIVGLVPDNVADKVTRVFRLYQETIELTRPTRQSLRQLAYEWAKVLDEAYDTDLSEFLPKEAVKPHLFVCHLEVIFCFRFWGEKTNETLPCQSKNRSLWCDSVPCIGRPRLTLKRFTNGSPKPLQNAQTTNRTT